MSDYVIEKLDRCMLENDILYGWRLPFRVQLDASKSWTRLAGRLRSVGDFHCRPSWRPAGRQLDASNFWRQNQPSNCVML